MKHWMIVTLFVLILSQPGLKAQNLYFPPTLGDTWETVSPESLGWCTPEIDPLLNFLEQENSKAFIVLKDGKIAIEKYFGTFTKDSLWYWASAGKTLTAFLVGQAQEDGLLSIGDSTSKYLGVGWTGLTPEQERKITIRHQLTMTTGLDDGLEDNHCTLDSCLQFLAEPGTRWAYHNAPYTLLEKVLTNASGSAINAFTRENLLSPTGMTGLWLTVDYDNVFFSKPSSMARFGLLVQNSGVWNKDTLLKDRDYFNAMINTSNEINQSYGYLWWLNGKPNYMLPGVQFVFNGSWAPDAPADMFAAMGKNGQMLCIVPSQGLVVVRMGNPGDSPLSEIGVFLCNMIWQKLNAVICSETVVEDIEFDTGDLCVFPNPSKGEITIHGYEGHAEIFNTSGLKVWQGIVLHGQPVSLKHLPAGFHLLKTCSGSFKFMLNPNR
ncbi:MAG TPA: serine hydrolase [Prolixibacteraceae bacterium]|nr:serine hydrolase [Prolixibacteraceae bacterium]